MGTGRTPPYANDLQERVAFSWPAFDAFYEEDERIVGHAPDNYHRIDIRQKVRENRRGLQLKYAAKCLNKRVCYLVEIQLDLDSVPQRINNRKRGLLEESATGSGRLGLCQIANALTDKSAGSGYMFEIYND